MTRPSATYDSNWPIVGATAGPGPFVIGDDRDPTAVMGRRIGAYVLDGLLAALLTALAVLAAGGLTEPRNAPTCTSVSSGVCLRVNNSVYTIDGAAQAALYLVPLLYALVFSVVLQGLTGTTPGKAAFGLRVVDVDGARPGIGRAFVRSLFLLVDGIGCCVPLVGLITALVSKGHRRVGDMVAHTLVIDRHDRHRTIVLPGRAAAIAPPPASPFAPSTPAPPPMPEPQWDPARSTYVIWEPNRRRWLAYDRASGQWQNI